MAGMTQPSLLDDHVDALSISALYDRIEVALARTFPRRATLWVRGEIQSVSDRTGHCYMDLIDPDGIRDRQSPVLKVKCWRTSWEPMSARLHKKGIVLEPGMVVALRGSIDFYKPRAEVSFLLAEIDVDALLGRLAQKRAALIEVLRTEGLLNLNRRQALPAVPLRIGLVASPGTEGHSDFSGQLVGSPYAFEIVLAAASVQGHQAPSAIAGALTALASRDCDMVVIVRGGGSKADLAAFDTEIVARAIANMP
ncbi:MAG: exodeoxyribonuclease VII large subunit, partial [Acidimicrobiales bacterium]